MLKRSAASFHACLLMMNTLWVGSSRLGAGSVPGFFGLEFMLATNQNAKDANKLCFISDLSRSPTDSSNTLMSVPSRFQSSSGGLCKAQWGAGTSELKVAYVFCRGKSFPL